VSYVAEVCPDDVQPDAIIQPELVRKRNGEAKRDRSRAGAAKGQGITLLVERGAQRRVWNGARRHATAAGLCRLFVRDLELRVPRQRFGNGLAA
jgi:hypothetical protein